MTDAFVLTVLTAAALEAQSAGASAADAPKIAVDLTTLTSPFWTAYNKYIIDEAKAQGVDLLQVSATASRRTTQSSRSLKF